MDPLELLKLRNSYCFHYRGQKTAAKYLKLFLHEDKIKYLADDLTVSPSMYETIDSFEELVSSAEDNPMGRLLRTRSLLVDFDDNLPDRQNLWKMLTITNPTQEEKNRALLVHHSRLIWTGGDDFGKYDKSFLRDVLRENNTFLWYYDIVVNKRFTRKVKVLITEYDQVRDVSEVLEKIFLFFGPFFRRKFIQPINADIDSGNSRYQVLFSTDREYEAIHFGRNFKFVWILGPYPDLVRFLQEEKTARRI